MTVIGYPNGLPAKVASGAVVLDERAGRRDYFTLNSDTFDGSSGSGVFDDRGELAGVFVRGGDDYEYRPEEECFVVRRIEDAPTPPHGEHAGYWAPAVAEWCASGAQSSLCSLAEASCSANAARPCAPIRHGERVERRLHARSALRIFSSVAVLALARGAVPGVLGAAPLTPALRKKNDERGACSTLAT